MRSDVRSVEEREAFPRCMNEIVSYINKSSKQFYSCKIMTTFGLGNITTNACHSRRETRLHQMVVSSVSLL